VTHGKQLTEGAAGASDLEDLLPRPLQTGSGAAFPTFPISSDLPWGPVPVLGPAAAPSAPRPQEPSISFPLSQVVSA
jgi:hypothetical protein